jgi:hypothetical protein
LLLRIVRKWGGGMEERAHADEIADSNLVFAAG